MPARWLVLCLLVFAFGGVSQVAGPRKAVDTQRQLLKDADDLLKGKHSEEALAAYQALIDHPIGDDADIRAAAIRGQVEARKLQSGLPYYVRRGLQQIPFWMELAALAALVALLSGVAVRLFPRRGTRVAFEELSTDRETRLNKSRVLTGLMMELPDAQEPERRRIPHGHHARDGRARVQRSDARPGDRWQHSV